MINPKFKDFVKDNHEILSEMFLERYNYLKDVAVLSPDEVLRNRAREGALEFKCWLIDIGLIKKPRKNSKKENFI